MKKMVMRKMCTLGVCVVALAVAWSCEAEISAARADEVSKNAGKKIAKKPAKKADVAGSSAKTKPVKNGDSAESKKADGPGDSVKAEPAKNTPVDKDAIFKGKNKIEEKKKEEKKGDSKGGNDESAVPVLKISGRLGVIYSFSNPNYTYYGGDEEGRGKSQKKLPKDSGGGRIATDSAEIGFTASGRLVNKWKYEAKFSMDAYKESIAIDKAYVTLERDNVGSFSAGNSKGPEATMLCGGQELFGGAGGFDGAASSDVDLAPGVLRMMNLVGYSSKATKLIYFTPVMEGFQFGMSYTPDTRHHGKRGRTEGTARSNGNDGGVYAGTTDGPYGEHNVGFGVSQEFKIVKDVSTKIAVVYVHEGTKDLGTSSCYDVNGVKIDGADLDSVKLNNVNGIHATATFTVKNLSVGFGCLSNGTSRMPSKDMYRGSGRETCSIGKFISDANGDAGTAWNVGAKYRITSKLVASTVYHNTTRKVTRIEKAKSHMGSVALDYVVCSGLKFFAEANYLRTKAGKRACLISSTVDSTKAGNIYEQDSWVFILGSKITF
jgi:hypothetical protein